MHNGNSNGNGQQSKQNGAVLPKPPPFFPNGNSPPTYPTENQPHQAPREKSLLEKALSETLEKAEAVYQAGSQQYTDLLRTEIRDLQVRLNASLEESNRLRALHDTAIVQGTKLLQQAVDLNAELVRERQRGKTSFRGQESNVGEWSMPETQADLDIQAEKHQSEKERLQARIKEMEASCKASSLQITAAQQQIQEMNRLLRFEACTRENEKREHEKLIVMARADGETGKEHARLRYEREITAHRNRISELEDKLDKETPRSGNPVEDAKQKRTRIITTWLNKNYMRHPDKTFHIAQRPFWNAFERYIQSLPRDQKEIISRPDPRELLQIANQVLGATTIQTYSTPGGVGDQGQQYWMVGIQPRADGDAVMSPPPGG
ncbi:hypothetical protein QFC22_006061 [Naganishia vaughanmartiniae]|uniref:Uncharacterized protein n=1 Tax=Naganishia vaughanmartiniae TaxID=1424756 RepID=A0ACC2WRQ2_9TREE|nr:hypothetical protein QFC22_006061 [Naganishia vaughanmartiniae]